MFHVKHNIPKTNQRLRQTLNRPKNLFPKNTRKRGASSSLRGIVLHALLFHVKQAQVYFSSKTALDRSAELLCRPRVGVDKIERGHIISIDKKSSSRCRHESGICSPPRKNIFMDGICPYRIYWNKKAFLAKTEKKSCLVPMLSSRVGVWTERAGTSDEDFPSYHAHREKSERK